MKKLMLSAAFASFFFASSSLSAQVMVTEFVKLGDDVELDVKSKSVDYAMNNNKGIKDLEWSNDTHILSITFDPRKTTVEDILRKLAEVTNNEAVASKATRRDSKIMTVASKMNP
jgi:hypothetical protein